MPRLNLRAKLILFAVVIAILPLIIAGQSLIRIAQDELKSSVNDQLVATARQVTDEIDGLYEQGWMAPLLLVRNAVDDERLGVPEKIALLTYGIAELTDVVAMQITVAGARLPLVVSQDRFSTRLKDAGVEPLTVLRTPAEVIEAAARAGGEQLVRVDHVPETDNWLATVVLPMKSPIAGAQAMFSARIDLTGLQAAIEGHPFQRTGSVFVVDAEGRRLFQGAPGKKEDLAIVDRALELLAADSRVVTVEPYQRPDGTAMLGAFAFPAGFDWAVIVEKSEEAAYFAIGQMVRSLGLWLAVGLGTAAIGALLFAFRISRPILAIGEAAIEVAKGNYRTRVTGVTSRDEIGDLAKRFNAMIVQINERFQLAKFVSGTTMTAIQSSDEGVKLGGQRRTVAILFADIRGYTSFAEKRDPELVVEVLNYYFQRQADLVAQHQGDIDKFVGDQIMAVFLGDQMGRNAVACALDIQDVMIELGREHPEWELDIGIGIDMGEVVMGAMGSNQRMDYTVLGDHVNLAARLCSHAAARETIISDAVAAAVTEDRGFRLRALEPISVKGKSAKLNVFAVSRAGAGQPAPAAAADPAVAG